jgi:hypothetical protein
LTGRGWRGLSARMSERKAEPRASFAAAAISGKEAEPWRVGIVDWFCLHVEEPQERASRHLGQTLGI